MAKRRLCENRPSPSMDAVRCLPRDRADRRAPSRLPQITRCQRLISGYPGPGYLARLSIGRAFPQRRAGRRCARPKKSAIKPASDAGSLPRKKGRIDASWRKAR
jgi:hypothetical protein